jgi:UbiD family decarboxylase
MAFNSFREWVTDLDRAGELIRIEQPVATELEITNWPDRQMKSPRGGKALLIEKADSPWLRVAISARDQHDGFVETDGDELGREFRG